MAETFLKVPTEPQEEEEKEQSIFLDLLGSISQSKTNLSEHERFDKDYVPFVINGYFSRFVDTVLYANELNKYNTIPKISQYRYLLNRVSRKKRFEKDPKENNDVLKMVAEYYGFSYAKAMKAMALLTEEQLKVIKQKSIKGGLK
jgi:hypothetical protein